MLSVIRGIKKEKNWFCPQGAYNLAPPSLKSIPTSNEKQAKHCSSQKNPKKKKKCQCHSEHQN